MKETFYTIASGLDHSKRYTRTKTFVNAILNDPENPYKKYIDLLIIFLIISSVAILMYEVKNPVPPWMDIYDIYAVSLVFLVEYLLRLWVVNDVRKSIIREHKEAEYLGREFNPLKPIKKSLSEKLDYMLTPSAIIDLLAIFPAYRPLRVLRLFVLFRILKLLRYSKNIFPNQYSQSIL
jgi:voltage-gated potassium channel